MHAALSEVNARTFAMTVLSVKHDTGRHTACHRQGQRHGLTSADGIYTADAILFHSASTSRTASKRMHKLPVEHSCSEASFGRRWPLHRDCSGRGILLSSRRLGKTRRSEPTSLHRDIMDPLNLTVRKAHGPTYTPWHPNFEMT